MYFKYSFWPCLLLLPSQIISRFAKIIVSTIVCAICYFYQCLIFPLDDLQTDTHMEWKQKKLLLDKHIDMESESSWFNVSKHTHTRNYFNYFACRI